MITLVGICLGIAHMAWQIVAHSRVGPPPVEPPVEVRPGRSGERRRYL